MPEAFSPKPLATRKNGAPGKTYTDPDSVIANQYTVGTSYLIATKELDQNATIVSSGTLEDIGYTATGAPSGFFLNPQSGELFGQFYAGDDDDEDDEDDDGGDDVDEILECWNGKTG